MNELNQRLKQYLLNLAGKLVTLFIFLFSILVVFAVPTSNSINAVLYTLTENSKSNNQQPGSFAVQLSLENYLFLDKEKLGAINDLNQEHYLMYNTVVLNKDFQLEGSGESIGLVPFSPINDKRFGSTAWLNTILKRDSNDSDLDSVIITRSYADKLIADNELPVNDYLSLIDFPIELSNNNSRSLMLKVFDIYDEQRQSLHPNFLNSFYNSLGSVFVVRSGSVNTIENFELYTIFSGNYYSNKIYFETLTNLFGEKTSINSIKEFPSEYNTYLFERDTAIESSQLGNRYREKFVIISGVLSVASLVVSYFFFAYFSKKSSYHQNGLNLNPSLFKLLHIFLYLFTAFILLVIMRNFHFTYSSGLIIPVANEGSLIALVFSLILVFITDLGSSNSGKVKWTIDTTPSLNIDDYVPLLILHHKNIRRIDSSINYQKQKNDNVRTSKNALIIGNLMSFPDVGAGALRCSNFIKMLVQMGYQCFASGWSDNPEDVEKLLYPGYTLYPYDTSKRKTSIQKLTSVLAQKKNIQRVITEIEEKYGPVDLIHAYSSLNVNTIKFLNEYCKNNNIKFFVDVVEAQILSQQSFTSFFTYYLGNNWIYRNANKKLDCGIIVISRWLQEHYQKNNLKNNPILYVPSINDTNSIPFHKNPINKIQDKTIFLHAGVANKGRDLLINMIKGFNNLDEKSKQKILFISAGNSPENLINDGLSLIDYKDSLTHTVYLGRVDRIVIDELYKSVDFTVLLKPEGKRLSKAGFPTKVSESWAHGIPAISNIESDLHGYLIDGFNGFVAENDSIESFTNVINRALSQEKHDYLNMRQNARKFVQENLDLNTYYTSYVDFINSIE